MNTRLDARYVRYVRYVRYTRYERHERHERHAGQASLASEAGRAAGSTHRVRIAAALAGSAARAGLGAFACLAGLAGLPAAHAATDVTLAPPTPPVVAQHRLMDAAGQDVGVVEQNGVQATIDNVTLFLPLERNPTPTGLSSTELRWRSDRPVHYASTDCSGTPLLTDGHAGAGRDIYRPSRMVRVANTVRLFVAAPGTSAPVASNSTFSGSACVVNEVPVTVDAWTRLFDVDLSALHPEPLHIQ